MADLTDQQKAFIHEMITEPISGTEAARRAGYANPREAATELYQTPGIASNIIKGKNAELSSWRDMVGMARNVIVSKMKDSRQITITTMCKACGEETKHTSEFPINDRIQLEAAKLTLTTMSKSSPGTLIGKADNEDSAETLDDVAKRVLGIKTEKSLTN